MRLTRLLLEIDGDTIVIIPALPGDTQAAPPNSGEAFCATAAGVSKLLDLVRLEGFFITGLSHQMRVRVIL